MTAAGTCPPLRVLDAYAAGSCADESVGAHVRNCAACTGAVDAAREVNTFLAGVRPFLAAGAVPAPEAMPESLNPDLVSGYQIQEEIHRGGQGVVYRAVQTRTRRTVAIKMLLGGHAATGRRKERFEREVRIAAGLRHPNIVTVHDSGYIGDGRYGLVMEYIEGIPLDRWSRLLDEARGRDARRKALRQRLGVMAKVCDAVLCAHQHSIVHRDLKPGNILVDSAGEPHVLDFGIARDTGPEQHTRLTYAGEFAGTMAYASPEQLSGDLSKVDTRTDIYSLGVIMYEMVSGRMPYAVDGPMSRVIRSIETAEPVPLPRVTRDPEGPWVDGEVSTIILKAMSKDPARRYQTAAGLRDDIARYLAGHAIEARRDSTWYILRKTAARHRIVVAGVAIIIVLLAVFGAAMAGQAHKLEARGRELATALSDSNVERGRSLAAAGSIVAAQDAVWPEVIGSGTTHMGGPNAGFAGTSASLQSYWALWDIFRRSKCLATLDTSHGSGFQLVYFDEGGKRLNAFHKRGRLVSWSVATWDQVRDISLVDPIAGVSFGAALGPDGRIAIFGGGLLRLVDPSTGALIAEADDPNDQAVTGAFSPEGDLMATIGRDNRLRLRNAHSLVTVLSIPENTVCKFDAQQLCLPTFSLDGTLIAAALPDGSLGLWSTTSGTLDRILLPPASLDYYVRIGMVPSRIAFGPDGTIAASLGTHLVAWPAGGSGPVDVGAHPGNIVAVGFLGGSDGRVVYSHGLGVTSLWNLAAGTQVATFGDSNFTLACASSPDGRLIAAAEQFVRVCETAPEPHVSVLHSGGGPGSVAALSPDGRLVALATGPGDRAGQDVLLFDRTSGTSTVLFHRDGARIVCLEFAPDGLSLLEGETTGRIMQWDLHPGGVGREFTAPDDAAPGTLEHQREPIGANRVGGENTMRLSSDGSILARARTGLIDLWEVRSGRWLCSLDTGTTERAVIDISRDGTLAAGLTNGSCVLWNIHSREETRTSIKTGQPFQAVRFSPDGKLLAFSARSRISFYDVDVGRVVLDNRVQGTSTMGMAFHPGGDVLIASAQDQSIRLWDTRTGRELLALQKHAAPIISLLLTPDGNTLVSSDLSGTVLVWDLGYYNGPIRRELAYRASKTSEP